MRVLSLGAGVQSSTLLLMACEGEIEKPDCAIFADTGWEPKAVYEWLDWLETRAAEAGIPVYRVTAGNIRDDALAGKPESWMPLYSVDEHGDPVKLKRQCTKNYKLIPIRRKARELMKAAGERHVEQWIGISLDELTRMKPADVKYITHRWPLIEQRMTRIDCLLWMERHGYQRPPKSSCIGCPFHNNGFWRDLKAKSPAEWAEAVSFEQEIQNGQLRVKEPVFLHNSRKPLDSIDFSTAQDKGQTDMFEEECDGMCGV